MGTYRADIDEARTYPTLGVTLQPGDIVATPSDVDIAGLTPVTDGKTTANVIARISVAPQDLAAQGVSQLDADPPDSTVIDVPADVDTPEKIDPPDPNSVPTVTSKSKPAPGADTTSAPSPATITSPPAGPTPPTSGGTTTS